MMNKKLLSVLGVVVIIVIISLLWKASQQYSKKDNTTTGLIMGKNAIFVSDQPARATLTVDMALLKKPGFIAVQEGKAGKPFTVIGTSVFLTQGEQKGVAISLTRTPQTGETLYALIYQDDGNGRFDAQSDHLALDTTTNEPIMATVTIDDSLAPPSGISL